MQYVKKVKICNKSLFKSKLVWYTSKQLIKKYRTRAFSIKIIECAFFTRMNDISCTATYMVSGWQHRNDIIIPDTLYNDARVKNKWQCMFTYKFPFIGLTHQTPTIKLEVFAGLRELHSNVAIRGISKGLKIYVNVCFRTLH